MAKNNIKKDKQIALLEKIAQLSSSGIKQRDIATQLSLYGHGLEKAVGQSCLDSIGQGLSFSHGLKQWLSTSAYQSVSSGENVGQFVEGINEAIGSLKVDEASTGALLRVLISPTLGLSAVFAISAVLSSYAYPSLIKQLPIHAIEYSLVGAAIAIFYLLLISLSEHLNFTLSYIIATFSCVALILYYLHYVLGNFKLALLFSMMLTLLYVLLFVIISAEDFAFLMGGILTFIIIGVVMISTRNIDWHSINEL